MCGLAGAGPGGDGTRAAPFGRLAEAFNIPGSGNFNAATESDEEGRYLVITPGNETSFLLFGDPVNFFTRLTLKTEVIHPRFYFALNHD